MKYEVYCMKDLKVGYLTPTFDVNEMVAIRNFSYAVNNNGLIGQNINDFELYRIGYFDSDSGLFSDCDPKFIVSAISVKEN